MSDVLVKSVNKRSIRFVNILEKIIELFNLGILIEVVQTVAYIVVDKTCKLRSCALVDRDRIGVCSENELCRFLAFGEPVKALCIGIYTLDNGVNAAVELIRCVENLTAKIYGVVVSSFGNALLGFIELA